LPIGAFVLGNAAYAVPVMVFQLLLYAPLAITLLGLDGGARRPGPSAVLAAGLRNPVSVGALSGVALSLWGGQLPAVLEQPLSLFGGMAVPGALLAFGISLSHTGRTGAPAREQVAVIAILKLALQPVVAFALARAWGLSPEQVRAVTVMAALPTAQNVFVYATRFGRGEAIARDAVAVTTLAAAPVILVIATVLVPG
jgi:predicted permease